MKLEFGGAKQKKKVMITGCGRMGSSIAGSLSEKGYEVTVIDENPKAFRKLPPIFSGFQIEGDATDIELLTKAGIESVDILMATADRDNANLMIAQIAAKIFNVREVYARFYDEDKEKLLAGTHIKAIVPSRLSLIEFERLSAIKMAEEEGPPQESHRKEEEQEKFFTYTERNEHKL